MNIVPRAPKRELLPIAGLMAGVWLLVIDAPTKISLGSISVSGALTLACAALLAFVCLTNWLGSSRDHEVDTGTFRRQRLPLALTLFLVFSWGWILINPSFVAAQNVAVYSSFILAILVGIRYRRGSATVQTLQFLRFCGAVAAIIFIVSNTIGLEAYGIRSIGLSGLVAMSVLIPHRTSNFWARLLPLIVVYAILISLSRTALLIALGLLVFLIVRSPRKSRALRGTALVVTCAAIIYVLFFTYEPLRDRFLGGDGGVSIGGVKFNTSGRSTLWEMTWESAMESPWFGQGPGSATNLISAIYPNISHPHNDYLRIFHDFGFLGFCLFFLGIIRLCVLVMKRALRSDSEVHWSAFLGLLIILMSAITDNIVIYSFAMMPIGLLVGLSLREPLAAKSARKASHKQTIDSTN